MQHCFFCPLKWYRSRHIFFFWLFPHSLALMHIIFSTHWGRVCVGGDMSQSYYFSYSFLCSIGLEGSGRPDTVQLWAWVTILATHSVWPACSMPFSLKEVNRHPSAATSPHTHSPIFVEWRSWYKVLTQWMSSVTLTNALLDWGWISNSKYYMPQDPISCVLFF